MTGKKKPTKRILNLNKYRNWNRFTENEIKEKWGALVAPQIYHLPKLSKIKIEFHYFKGSRRKCDRANVLCIHEKYICDALQKYDAIPDDNDDYIDSTHYISTSYDKENPRVEMIITEV